MLLDLNTATGAFWLKVPRGGPDLATLMREAGLDFSLSASTKSEAVLLTHEPYAAVAFADNATPRAREALAPLMKEIERSWAATSNSHIECPPDKELWGYQKAGVDYARGRKYSLDGDQPGLGKTPTAICLANEYQARRILVICPASIRKQWVEKIRDWTTMKFPFVIHPIFNGRNGVDPTAEWTVVSYELARTPAIGRALAAGDYDLLILDEAHYIKTVDARRTRAIFGGGDTPAFDAIAGKARSILALTGTPLPNRPREAYTLARGLCWEAIDWMSEDAFKERFNPSERIEIVDPVTHRSKFYVDERVGRHSELQARLRGNFMFRHLKRDVLPQLKLPVFDIIELEATKAVKQALEAESLLNIDPSDYSPTIEVMGQISTVRELMGLALAPQIADYIDMLLDGGEDKLVVFGWHLRAMSLLEERWRKHGVARYHAGRGSHNEAEKKRFIQDPDCHILLGNSLTLGTGTDGLQDVAWHALIAEPDWVPENNVQCFSRLDRFGQKAKVQGDIFVAPNSIVEKILAVALRKMQTVHKALDRRMT